MKKLLTYIVTFLMVASLQVFASSANGPIYLPKGPYNSTLLAVDILNTVGADFTAVTLQDGTIRGYLPSMEGTFAIFESNDDGKSFNRVGKVEFNDPKSDAFVGQPRVILLNDGRYHLYSNGPQGISCFSSKDGFTFIVDKLQCVPNSAIPTPPHYKSWRLSGPAIAYLSDGSYRMYFGDEGIPGDGKFPPHQIYSAKSRDGINWVVEPGVRIGHGSKSLKSIAIHPEVIQHSDGSVTLFYRSYIPQNMKYASSKNGLEFSDEYILWTSKRDPIVGYGNEGGDPSIVKDRNGNIVLFQGTWTGPEKFGISAFRLSSGKGIKFGEEAGRYLGWQGGIANRYINCISNANPNDPINGKVWVLASSSTDLQCPDEYSISKTNPEKTEKGPVYSKLTKCKWNSSSDAPNGLAEVFFSGEVSCPEGFVIAPSATNNSSPNKGSSTPKTPNELICYAGPNLSGATPILKITDGSTKCPPDYSTKPPSEKQSETSNPSGTGAKCFAKSGMVVSNPVMNANEGDGTCPPGYSTTPNKIKQTKINCVALPSSNVNPKKLVLYGIGKVPQCPKGYKKG